MCECKVEVRENRKVIRYSNIRFSDCWKQISMRSDNEVQCMAMYVSRYTNMSGEVGG